MARFDGLARTMLDLVRTPGLSHAAACAVAVIMAAVISTGGARPEAWVGAGLVLVVAAIDLAMTPPYERDRSLRPVKHLVLVSGAVLLTGTASGWLGPVEVRGAGAVVLGAAVVQSLAVAVASRSPAPRTVLVVGGRVGVGQLIAQWATTPQVEVVGICLPEPVSESGQEIGLVPVLGSFDDVAIVARELGVAEVVLVPGPLLSGYHVRRLSWALEDSSIELAVAAEMDGVVPRRVTPRVLGRRLTFTVRPGGRTRPGAWAKALLDRIGAATLLVLLSPLFAVVALLIRLGSPGPALFTQTRVGRDGRPFTIFKFRTMQIDAEERLDELRCLDEGAGPLFKVASDPRITPLGRLLRSCSVDEVPQLLNVLRGEMSLIGPRPGLPVETRMYDEWIHRRLRVKPGMTGAWQVGGRSNLSWTDSVRLDIDYVDNATLRDDLRIAMRTAGAVMTREGAV